MEDISLKNVSGGLSKNTKYGLLAGGVYVAMPVGIVGGAACSIASAVYSAKTHKAMRKGDTKNAEKYAKITKGLTIAAASFAGVGVAGIASTATELFALTTKNYND